MLRKTREVKRVPKLSGKGKETDIITSCLRSDSENFDKREHGVRKKKCKAIRSRSIGGSSADPRTW